MKIESLKQLSAKGKTVIATPWAPVTANCYIREGGGQTRYNKCYIYFVEGFPN